MKFGKMKPHRRNRLLLVVFLVLTSGGAVGLALRALNQNINLFYSPQQIVDGEAPVGRMIRAGGMVLNGSVKHAAHGLTVSFVISDLKNADVPVEYTGILPDLFREGQGVVARGMLNKKGVFVAQQVLAKHDEKYMPPEVKGVLADAKKAGKTSEAGKTL